MYHVYRLAPHKAWALHGFLRRRTTLLPAVAPTPFDWTLLIEQAGLLGASSRGLGSPADAFDLARRYPGIASNQHRTEILPLLELLRERQPRQLCEIGSARGGTLFLFAHVAHPQARILSIDMNNNVHRKAIFARLVQPGQELTCIDGSSHSSETRDRFRAWVGRDPLDFVFIDGDHSAEGVARDYADYASFVRAGGLVAFHDIVPDYRSRYGIDTGAYTGGVPAFWSGLDKGVARVHEFVEHPLQDGYGIGVIEVAR